MKQALNASQTDDVFLILLTISHASLSPSIRVSSDAVDTISNSNTFVAFPFDLSLPDDTDSASPRARLSIDNVDRQIVTAIRSISTAPSVLIQIVRAEAPNTIEASFADFKLTNISYDAHVVSGDLTVEDFTSEPFPAGKFTPSLFPGLFG